MHRFSELIIRADRRGDQNREYNNSVNTYLIRYVPIAGDSDTNFILWHGNFKYCFHFVHLLDTSSSSLNYTYFENCCYPV